MTNQKLLKPIDRLAITVIVFLTLIITLMIGTHKLCGNNCWLRISPKIEEFTWKGKEIEAKDTAFIITFDRPMDRPSVEENLSINPPLPGKFSWAGRRLAYTLYQPAPYGENYQLNLDQAFSNNDELIQPFVAEFSSRDRAFAYIGSQKEEKGRLIFYNLTRKIKKILTPSNLIVFDFQFYPDGQKILFSAAPKNNNYNSLQELKLYQVKTSNNETYEKSSIELILDNKEYQNNQFDLSADGEKITIQRVSRENTANFDLWLLEDEEKPKRLNIEGGEFTIAPDSKTLAVAKGEGIGLFPLDFEEESNTEKSNAKKSNSENGIDFLPKFGKLLSFSPDGKAAALVNFNTDNPQLRFTRSLYYVNNLGVEKELFNTKGSIIDCQFNPTSTHLYCLLTELISETEYKEKPYFAEINIETSKINYLLDLVNYQDIKFSIAPDGLGILFDQIITSNSTDSPLTNNLGESIVGGRLWLLIPPSIQAFQNSQAQLVELPLVGFYPQWAP